MTKIAAFIVLTVGNILISRKTLKAFHSHGFFRFFAWEFIGALFLVNVDAWFLSPWSWHQLVSWFLLFSSLIPLVFGFLTLGPRGKPVQRREVEPQLLAFEKTTVLVTTGIYHYIRHPLYSSLLLLAWGIFFKAPTVIGLFLALVATIFLLATARADESECIRFFGSAYENYIKQTKMFIPFVF